MGERISRTGVIAMTFSGFLRYFEVLERSQVMGWQDCIAKSSTLQSSLAFYEEVFKKYAQSIDKRLLNLHNKERLNKETQKTSCNPVSKKQF